MKEKYFSLETIDEKTKELLRKTKTYLSDKKQEFHPEKSALIILDMQKYFCENTSHAFIPSAEAIIPKIKQLIEYYNSYNLPVIFTRHINTSKNAVMMNKWWKELILENNISSEIIENFNLAPSAQNQYLLKKTQYDAFYNTDLENILKQNNISQVVITGVMTHLCCETTARSAFVRGFEVFTPINATATYNEDFHLSSMLNLGHGFACLTTAEELCRI
jgi:isochorismate hydrolase